MSIVVQVVSILFKYVVPIMLTAAFIQLETEHGGASTNFLMLYEAVLFAAGIITYRGMAGRKDG